MTETKGFYGPLFTAAERRDLAAVPADTTSQLSAEIDVVRVSIRRMFKISKHQNAEEAVRTLAILSAVSGRLSGLLRIQQQLKTGIGSGDTDLRIMLEQVLVEVQVDWPKIL